MASLQTTRRQTRKGSKKLTDDNRAAQIAKVSAAQIAKFDAAREKITYEERQAEITSVRKQLGILPRKPLDVDEGPNEADTTEETDMTEQAAVPIPEDKINSSDDNANDDEDDNKDEDNNNTSQPRTARKQGCEDHTDESLFSDNSDADHDDNDHHEDYSESSDGENRKKKRPRRSPKS